jgi:hypothetical protein
MEKEKRSGISIQTLVISSAAAVAAAVIIPTFWEQGTLVATAMTPVIVALVSEGLRRPAEKITAVTPLVVRPRPRGGPKTFDPLPPPERVEEPAPAEQDPFGLRERPPLRRHWRLAVATGVAAFVVAVGALTVSELVFGGPATRDSGRTTFFGRGEATPTPSATPDATPEATTEATPTPEVTPTPTETPEPTATPGAPEATPAPTVTP